MPGKKEQQSENDGKIGELFVQLLFANIGIKCVWGDAKTPSIEGFIRIYDEVFQTWLALGVQVKTGKSHVIGFNRRTPHFFLKNLSVKDINDWRSANIPVIIVWVNHIEVENRDAFWADTNRCKLRTKRIKIFKTSHIDKTSVAKLLNIARVHSGLPSVPLISTPPLFPASVTKAKIEARQFYNTWRNEKTMSPLFGPVGITLRAWRHITRTSSSQREICHKLACLSCAKELISTGTSSRFLRRISNDKGHIGTDKSQLNIRELHAITGVHQSRFQSDILIEVVIEVDKYREEILSAKLYSVHEKRSQRVAQTQEMRRKLYNLPWIEM